MNEMQNVMFFRKKNGSFSGEEHNQKNKEHTGILICYIKNDLNVLNYDLLFLRQDFQNPYSSLEHVFVFLSAVTQEKWNYGQNKSQMSLLVLFFVIWF